MPPVETGSRPDGIPVGAGGHALVVGPPEAPPEPRRWPKAGRGRPTTEPGRHLLFAVYHGQSMHPTLGVPDVMEVVPHLVGDRIRAGDVILFQRRESTVAIVHRVVRVTPGGLVTRGDHNAGDDQGLVQPQEVVGQVVAALRGQRRRPLHGRRRGLVRHYLLRGQRLVWLVAARALGPAWRALVARAPLAGWVPHRWAPRVVAFQGRGGGVLRLVMGGRRVGEYDSRRQQWVIRRPYRLVVSARALAELRPTGPETSAVNPANTGGAEGSCGSGRPAATAGPDAAPGSTDHRPGQRAARDGYC